jgi:hypothetical protein
MNEITLFAVREARLSALRGEVPSIIGTMLELVEDAAVEAAVTTLDELCERIAELRSEEEQSRVSFEAEIDDLEVEKRTEYDRAESYKTDLKDLSERCDAAERRAELAENALAEARKGMHALRVTRRGNVLHIALPAALCVPSAGSQPWNTLSVPVIAEKEPVKGSKKRDVCQCCTVKGHTTLSWTAPL